MREVEEQLRLYGAALERELTQGEMDARVWEVERPRRHRLRRPALVAAAAAVAVVAAVLMADAPERDSQVATSGPAPTETKDSLFSTPTDVVLLLSDGIDGVTALDLDRRVAGRRVIEGERAGDQQFRLTLTADHLVVGWGEVYAAPLSGAPSVKIADAAVYVPAAEPGQIWALTWDGGGVGRGRPKLQRLTVDGTEVFTSESFDAERLTPLLGVPDGLAVQTPNGVAIWEASTGELAQATPSGPPSAIASDGRHLAWCERTCTATRVLTLDRAGPPTAAHVSQGRQQLALSPDGRYLAILRPRDGSAALVLQSLTTGEEHVVGEPLDEHGALQWSADGAQLFYTENSYGRDRTRVGRYTTADGRWEARSIPLGGAVGGVAVSPRQARSFFSPQHVDPADCPVGGRYPTGRKGVCTFTF